MRILPRTKPWQRPLREVNHEPAPRAFKALVHVARMVIPLLTTRRWLGQEHIPATGGVIVVANHVSNYDAVVLGEYLIWAGRWPHFLGKIELWRVPVLGWVARACEQIPVERGTAHASDALVHARRALEAGQMVTIYPEGTITKDPDGWPMTARHGAARLALQTGMPVIPAAQIGAENVLGGHKVEVRKLFSLRRRPVAVKAGPALDLSRFGQQDDPTKETLEQVSVQMMDAITDLYAELRGEPAPSDRWDLRRNARVPQSRS